jgi:hypothetical protein
LARAAFPGKDIETCKELHKKFLETVPAAVSRRLTRMALEYKTLHNRRVRWTNMLDTITIEKEIPAQDKTVEVYPSQAVEPETPVQPRRSWTPGNGGQSPRRKSGQVNTNNNGRGGRTFVNSGRQENQRPRGRTNSSSSSGSGAGEVEVCQWCTRVGHNTRDCRRRTGACLACGSMEHRVGQCSRLRARSGERRGDVSRKFRCPDCQGDHPGIYCPNRQRSRDSGSSAPRETAPVAPHSPRPESGNRNPPV